MQIIGDIVFAKQRVKAILILSFSLMLVFSLVRIVLPEIASNIGKNLLFKSVLRTYDGYPVTLIPLYGIGLIGDADNAPVATWQLAEDMSQELESFLESSIRLLEFNRFGGGETGRNAVWLARIYLIDLQSMRAEDWAEKAISNGLVSGFRELAYIYDFNGEHLSAADAYASANSGISAAFQAANLLGLIEECQTDDCVESHIQRLPGDYSKNPVLLWSQIGTDPMAEPGILFAADWFQSEPRLQIITAEILSEALEKGVVSRREAEEMLEAWLNRKHFYAARTFLELTFNSMPEPRIHDWSIRLAAAVGDYAEAYDLISKSTMCQDTNCWDDAIYVYRLAERSDVGTQAVLLKSSLNKMRNYVREHPLDVMARQDVTRLESFIGSGSMPDNALSISPHILWNDLVNEACPGSQVSEISESLVAWDVGQEDSWSWAVRTGSPYGEALYDWQVINTESLTYRPTMHLQGIAVAPLQNEQWPSWVGAAPKFPYVARSENEVYLLSFAYRTSGLREGQSARVDVSPGLDFWLPSSHGEWRYYGIVLSMSMLEGLNIRPAFRLHNSQGSFDIQDVQLRRIDFRDEPQCPTTAGEILRWSKEFSVN